MLKPILGAMSLMGMVATSAQARDWDWQNSFREFAPGEVLATVADPLKGFATAQTGTLYGKWQLAIAPHDLDVWVSAHCARFIKAMGIAEYTTPATCVTTVFLINGQDAGQILVGSRWLLPSLENDPAAVQALFANRANAQAESARLAQPITRGEAADMLNNMVVSLDLTEEAQVFVVGEVTRQMAELSADRAVTDTMVTDALVALLLERGSELGIVTTAELETALTEVDDQLTELFGRTATLEQQVTNLADEQTTLGQKVDNTTAGLTTLDTKVDTLGEELRAERTAEVGPLDDRLSTLERATGTAGWPLWIAGGLSLLALLVAGVAALLNHRTRRTTRQLSETTAAHEEQLNGENGVVKNHQTLAAEVHDEETGLEATHTLAADALAQGSGLEFLETPDLKHLNKGATSIWTMTDGARTFKVSFTKRDDARVDSTLPRNADGSGVSEPMVFTSVEAMKNKLRKAYQTGRLQHCFEPPAKAVA